MTVASFWLLYDSEVVSHFSLRIIRKDTNKFSRSYFAVDMQRSIFCAFGVLIAHCALWGVCQLLWHLINFLLLFSSDEGKDKRMTNGTAKWSTDQ